MQTPSLEHLMSAYFHQDWYEEHGDEWANLQDFVEGEPELAPRLPIEIEQVLAHLPTDDRVDAYLRSLGSYYTTTPEEGGYRGFLQEIARRVQTALARQH